MIQKKGTLENFMGTFNIVPMELNSRTDRPTLENMRLKILDDIKFNVSSFRNNTWSRKTNVHKMLVDVDTKRHLCVFTIRLGGVEIYKCNCQLLDIESKVEFLLKFYEAILEGLLDKNIISYCEKKIESLDRRKQTKNNKRKSQRKALKEHYLRMTTDAIMDLPQLR